MRVRGIGLTLALVLLGAALGYGIGVVVDTEPSTFASVRPVPARSPSVPVLPTPPYDPDIGYPPLGTGLDYRPRTIGDPPFRWAYDVPLGWTPEQEGFVEVRWRPADEPIVGGYSLRVKITNEHKTDEEMVEQKEAAVTRLYDDVEIDARTEDLLAFRYREPATNRLRFNTFRWFTPPGGSASEFEMSVVGRKVDVAGLEELLDHVASTVRKVP